MSVPVTLPRASARQGTLRSEAVAIAMMVGALACVIGGVVVATYLGRVDLAAAGAVGLLLLLVGLRWPDVPLCAYVLAIPFDDVVQFGDFGSLGRSAAIAFAIAYVLPRIGRLKPSVMPTAGWAYMGWAILSIGWAINPDLALQQIGTLIQLFLIGVLIADVVVNDASRVRLILWVYSLSAAAAAVVGILAYLSGQVIEGERVAALAGQSAAQFAALVLPAFVFGLHELVTGRLKMLSFAVLSVTGIAIMLSGTRAVWVGAIVATVVFVVPRLPPTRQVVAAVSLAALLVLAIQIPGATDFINERTGTAISTGGAGRTSIWNVGIGIVESSPIVGVGHGNFPSAFTPEMIRATNPYDLTDTGRGPHNIVLGTTGELGVIGIVMLAMFLGPLVLRAGWGPYGPVVQAILASLMVSALFMDILSNRKQVWLVIGLAAGLTYLRRHLPEPVDSSVGPVAAPVAEGG
jgi:O-antigen ligase